MNIKPESVIAKIEAFNPTVKSVVADTRKAPGAVAGVAAIACQFGLRGGNNAETEANLIRFAQGL